MSDESIEPPQKPVKKVGYCSPPEHGKFKEGSSGNPKGRPKGAKNIATIIKQVGTMALAIKIPGHKGKPTVAEAVAYSLAQKALKDSSAADKFLKLYTMHGPPPEPDLSGYDPAQDAAALAYLMNAEAAVPSEEDDDEA
jgi:hypothetical protein